MATVGLSRFDGMVLSLLHYNKNLKHRSSAISVHSCATWDALSAACLTIGDVIES